MALGRPPRLRSELNSRAYSLILFFPICTTGTMTSLQRSFLRLEPNPIVSGLPPNQRNAGKLGDKG